MSSGTKRKVEQLGEYMISAAVGDVVSRTMSAALGRYEAGASVDDQLQGLGMLLTTVHTTVEAAEGVHIRSWWLRRWLWRLRDAALDGDEVLRIFTQHQRADEETDAATRQAAGKSTVWSAAWRALRSVKSLLFGRVVAVDGNGKEWLSRMLARLEREAMGVGDFLKVLELEIRRSLAVQPELAPPVPPARSSSEPPPVAVPLPFQPAAVHLDPDRLITVDTGDLQSQPPPLICLQQIIPATTASAQKNSASSNSGDRSRFDHGLSAISHEEYVAGMRKMGLLIVRQRVRRALDWWLMISRKPPAPPAASYAPTPDTDRIRELAARIQRAIRATTDATALDSHGITPSDFHDKRRWLSSWSSQLFNVACRAEYSLFTVVVSRSEGGDGDGADVMVAQRVVGDERVRRAAHNVEMAAAELEDFVTLGRFALASLGRPSAHT